MIEVKGNLIKNDFNELTLKEFEKIAKYLNDESLDYIEKYIEVLKVLGMSEDIIEDLDTIEFVDVINKLKVTGDFVEGLTKQFEINGFTYVAYVDEFKLKIKDMSLIEKIIKQNPNEYLVKVCSLIFKRSDLSDIEHYAEAHLQHKNTLFESLPAKEFLSYLMYIQEKFIKKINLLNGKS